MGVISSAVTHFEHKRTLASQQGPTWRGMKRPTWSCPLIRCDVDDSVNKSEALDGRVLDNFRLED